MSEGMREKVQSKIKGTTGRSKHPDKKMPDQVKRELDLGAIMAQIKGTRSYRSGR